MKRDVTMIVVFIICIVCMPVSWFFLETKLQGENTENHTLAAKPHLAFSTIMEYPAQFDSYTNDHLPFKTQFVSLNAKVNLALFRSLDSKRVFLGKNGWLFYRSATDGESIPDYKRNNLFTQEELETVSQKLQALQTFCDNHGIKFVFYIAPNKEQIYSEYMHSFVVQKQNQIRAEQLTEHLKESTNIATIYPKDSLIKAKQTHEVYYKTDTHWNAIGAFVGTQELLAAVGEKTTPLSSMTFAEKGKTPGDLSKMEKLYDLGYYSTDYQPLMDISYKVLTSEKDKATRTDRFTNTNGNGKTLYMIRDSFGEGMYSYVANTYSNAIFQHRNSFKGAEAILDAKTDVLVYEIAERYLGELFKIDFTLFS